MFFYSVPVSEYLLFSNETLSLFVCKIDFLNLYFYNRKIYRGEYLNWLTTYLQKPQYLFSKFRSQVKYEGLGRLRAGAPRALVQQNFSRVWHLRYIHTQPDIGIKLTSYTFSGQLLKPRVVDTYRLGQWVNHCYFFSL